MGKSNIIFVVLIVLLTSTIYANDLLVYLPGEVSHKKIQKELSEALGVKVKAFKKVKTFHKAIKKNKSVALIAPGALVENLPGYSLAYQGHNASSGGEKYLIISTDPSISKNDLLKKKVGVWNIFGRKNVKKVVKKYFGIKIKKTKLVNKNEDLLTLLGIDMVDAILISDKNYSILKQNTDLKLHTVAESIKLLPLPVAATPKGNNGAVLKKINKIPTSISSKYYIDTWSVK